MAGALPDDDLQEIQVNPAFSQGPSLERGRQRNQNIIDSAVQSGNVITDQPALTQYKAQRSAARKQKQDAKQQAKVDAKSDPLLKRFTGWFKRAGGNAKDAWNKGKDDPLTPEREDETEEVTRFMGGMSRQELGMFIFQWGGLMMQNADQGFGGAMGAASLGALDAHMGRRTAAQESALKDREMEQKDRELDIAERGIRPPTIEWGQDGGFYMQYDGVDEKGNPKYKRVPLLNAKGEPVFEANDEEYKGEAWYLINQAESVGIPKEQVLAAKLGQKTRPEQLTWYREQLQTLVTQQKAKVNPQDKKVMEALGTETWSWVGPDGQTRTKPIHEMTPRDIGEYASFTLRQAESAEADYQAADAAIDKYRD